MTCLSLRTYVGPIKALTTPETLKLASNPGKPELGQGNNKKSNFISPTEFVVPTVAFECGQISVNDPI